MTEEAQRLAIAIACGWTRRLVPATKDGPDNPYGEFQYTWWTNPKGEEKGVPPDYLNDLNAMHEVENALPVPLRSFYCDWLMYGQANPNPRPETFGRWQTVNATAVQRAEAFLHTIGKWKD